MRLFYFAAVVTLLVNDATTKEQRNTTVAVLGKGSSFGVWILMPFFAIFGLNSFSSWRFNVCRIITTVLNCVSNQSNHSGQSQ